jgi:glycosyltransferase involved in cell wall biosynthesis
MFPRSKELSLCIVASSVGKTPEEVTHSFVYDEVVRLVKRGVEVHVSRFKFEGSGRSSGIYFHDIRRKFEPAIVWWGTKLLHYPLMSLNVNPKKMYKELLYSYNISKIVKKVNPDIVHAHFAYPEGWCALLARTALARNVPLIVTTHGYDLNVLPEYNYGIRLHHDIDLMVRKVLALSNCIIAVSRDLMHIAKELGATNVVYIPNGVDTTVFNTTITSAEVEVINDLKKSWGIEDAEAVVGFFRHLMPHYGVHYLLLAARHIFKATRAKVKFVVAGDGDRNYIEVLRKGIAKLNLKNNIIYLGKLPRTVMPLIYKATDIVVNTSLTDGMPPSILEALASGKPVISFAVGGNKDVIVNGFNGFLIPSKDYKGLAERLLYLVENPSEIRKMGLNGRKLVEERYDAEKRVDKIVRLYKVLSSSRPP